MIKQSNLRHKDFKVGDKVKVVCEMQDFHYFKGDEGRIIRHKKGYLGIIVKFDKPRRFQVGYVQKEFNFNPSDLIKT